MSPAWPALLGLFGGAAAGEAPADPAPPEPAPSEPGEPEPPVAIPVDTTEPAQVDPRTLPTAPRVRRVPPRWAGRRPPPEADFFRGDTEIKLRLAFNGTSPNPFTVLTALAGWNELSLSVDVGVASWRNFTLGVGGELHHGQSLILGAITAPVANYDDVRFGWSESETGAALRFTAHTTVLSSVDPYLMVALGGAAFRIEANVIGAGIAPAEHTSGYLRFEAGGGLTWRLGTKGWVVGVELRYLLTADLDPIDRFLFVDDGDLVVFRFAEQHRPPKGFSWVVHAGYRF